MIALSYQQSCQFDQKFSMPEPPEILKMMPLDKYWPLGA